MLVKSHTLERVVPLRPRSCGGLGGGDFGFGGGSEEAFGGAEPYVGVGDPLSIVVSSFDDNGEGGPKDILSPSGGIRSIQITEVRSPRAVSPSWLNSRKSQLGRWEGDRGLWGIGESEC
eukprot:scaffold8966_cov132-Isochrysis_galbana.AAC.9